MGYATITDYQALFGTVAAGTEDQVTAWLDLVSAVIASRLPTEPDAAVAKGITCIVVERIMSNPGNVRTKQSGGTSVTFAMVGKMITDEEWAMLAGDKIGGEAGTMSLIDEVYRPSPEQLLRRRYDDGWVPG